MGGFARFELSTLAPLSAAAIGAASAFAALFEVSSALWHAASAATAMAATSIVFIEFSCRRRTVAVGRRLNPPALTKFLAWPCERRRAGRALLACCGRSAPAQSLRQTTREPPVTAAEEVSSLADAGRRCWP